MPGVDRDRELLGDLGELGLEPGHGRLSLLELLHDLELLVLEHRDPAVEGGQLVLHALEVLGAADRPGVHPLLVAPAAGLDRLDIGVGLLLHPLEVVAGDPGVAYGIVGGLLRCLQLRHDGGLRQVRTAVAQLERTRVQLTDVEQLHLGERVGFQRILLSYSRSGSTGR